MLNKHYCYFPLAHIPVGITGASGGLGYALVQECTKRGADAIGISRQNRHESFHHPETWSPEHYKLVILNAGFGMLEFADSVISTNDFSEMISVNVIQTIKDAQRALAGGAWHVHIVSSIIGIVSSPYYSLYAATKYAVRGWAYGAARELPGRVSISYPNGIDTPYFTNLRGNPTLLESYASQVEAARQTYDKANTVASGILDGIQAGAREIIPTSFALEWFERNGEDIRRMWKPGLTQPSIERWDWWEHIHAQFEKLSTES